MRRYIIFMATSFMLLSCNNQKDKKPSFDTLEFSFTNTFGTAFLMKLTPDNVVFVKQYFPWPIQTFRGVLTQTENQKIDSFLKNTPFAIYDTAYYERYQDGSWYQFYLKTDSLEKTILVHSNSSPRGLDQFARWMVQLKEHLSLVPIDTGIEFKSDNLFSPPKLKDTIRYTVPKAEGT